MRTETKQEASLARRILSSIWLKMAVFLVLFVLLALLFSAGTSTKVQEKQVEYLEEAVQRAAVQCYALEGRFPDNLAYLEENYGLIIDRKHYAVYYESMGGNLLPHIQIIALDR